MVLHGLVETPLLHAETPASRGLSFAEVAQVLDIPRPETPTADTRHPVLEQLAALDPDELTPREALELLFELQQGAKESGT